MAPSNLCTGRGALTLSPIAAVPTQPTRLRFGTFKSLRALGPPSMNAAARSRILGTPDSVHTRCPSTVSAAAEAAATTDWSSMSYSRQYDELIAQHLPLESKKPMPKPNRHAQDSEPGCKQILLSDVHAVPKRPLLGREWTATDVSFAVFIGGMHLLACLAPFTFSLPMLGLFAAMYFVSGCLGITLSFHRQLSHRSFTTPKWLEYLLAYCGVLAAQGGPIDWVSTHRYHHFHCDTPLDPHSTYEGFWWAHMGWLLDQNITAERVGNRGNAADLESQPYYRFLQSTWILHVGLQFAILFALGGLPAVVWGGALRMVWVYHITWFVNSASHLWGDQTYNTGDLSRNNWWVGLLGFGEGWHNNHHAFEYSARHGLEWWQFDMTWVLIRTLQLLGLASNVKLPSEAQKERLRIVKTTQTPSTA